MLVRHSIIINSTPQEARVALLENETLVEIHIERAQQRSIAELAPQLFQLWLFQLWLYQLMLSWLWLYQLWLYQLWLYQL